MLNHIEKKEYYANEIPHVCFELEDCWNAAIISIAYKHGIDYVPVFADNVFFYQECMKKVSFNNILCGTYLHEVSNNNKISLLQQRFSKEFLGFECKTLNLNNNVFNKDSYIIWCDTFNCPWNLMYQISHYPHCFSLSSLDEEYCEVIDPSIITYKIRCSKWLINKIAYQILEISINTILGSKRIDIDKLIKYYTVPMFDDINLAEYSYKNTKKFVRDFEDMSKQISIIDSLDVNVVKLLVRFLKSNAQKCMLACEYFNYIEYKELNNINSQLGMRWKNVANLFMKLYYINPLKRSIIFEKINILLNEMVDLSKEKMVIIIDKGR